MTKKYSNLVKEYEKYWKVFDDKYMLSYGRFSVRFCEI
jgi:hypothetical protein